MRNLIAAFFHIAALILALLALVPALVLLYWTLDRTRPIDKIAGRFVQWESLNPPVVQIYWSGDRQRICLGQTKSWVFSEKATDLPATALPHKDSVTPEGDGPVKWMESVEIPANAFSQARADMTLNVRFIWYCNPLQEYWPLQVDALPIVLPVPDHLK